MGKRTLKNIAVVAGIAAAVGYVAGLLTAPKSGEETRADMSRTARASLREAERQLKRLSSELADLLDEAKRQGKALSGKASSELDDMVDKARAAREKAREMVSAVHEGDAEDEDLQTAVHQANSALKHLREYLKK